MKGIFLLGRLGIFATTTSPELVCGSAPANRRPRLHRARLRLGALVPLAAVPMIIVLW